MVRIGVTGLMASGKSTVARRFEERGAARIDGDALGWETLRADEVRDRIRSAFGPCVLDADGAIDRSRLGRIVFGDPSAMDRLNAIVQPALLALVRERLAAPGNGPGLLVLDAALISTWHLEPELDGIVLVEAPERSRVDRLRAGRSFTAPVALARIRGQRLPELREARRVWRITNDGDMDALLRRADQVWDEIAALQS